MSYLCYRRCSHGGVCTLDKGHEGNHDAGGCIFSEDEAVSDLEGDAVFANKAPLTALFLPDAPLSE